MLQVLSTLHEYPCLETCTPLVHYISICVRLAWKMINQKVPYYLDNDFNLGNYYDRVNHFILDVFSQVSFARISMNGISKVIDDPI